MNKAAKEVFAGQNKYGQDVNITFDEICGRVSYKDWGLTQKELETRLGSEIGSRIPSQDDFIDLKGIGFVPWYLEGVAEAQTSWWDILLLGALKHAKETIILVAPQEFVIARQVSEAAIEQGKTAIHVPLGKFTSEELRKLTNLYWLTHRSSMESNDVNEPLYRSQLMETFEEIMQRFWE